MFFYIQQIFISYKICAARQTSKISRASKKLDTFSDWKTYSGLIKKWYWIAYKVGKCMKFIHILVSDYLLMCVLYNVRIKNGRRNQANKTGMKNKFTWHEFWNHWIWFTWQTAGTIKIFPFRSKSVFDFDVSTAKRFHRIFQLFRQWKCWKALCIHFKISHSAYHHK